MAKRRKRISKYAVEAPTSSCLIICNDVMTGTLDGRTVINGIIDGLVLSSTPAVIGPFVAYIRFSNVYAEQKISLSFARPDDEHKVFELPLTAPKQSDPLKTHTLVIRINQFEIKESGRYIFQASHGGVAFAQSPIDITTLETPDGE
jgi:hypothetical protein